MKIKYKYAMAKIKLQFAKCFKISKVLEKSNL